MSTPAHQAISLHAGWALCGHEVPAGFGVQQGSHPNGDASACSRPIHNSRGSQRKHCPDEPISATQLGDDQQTQQPTTAPVEPHHNAASAANGVNSSSPNGDSGNVAPLTAAGDTNVDDDNGSVMPPAGGDSSCNTSESTDGIPEQPMTRSAETSEAQATGTSEQQAANGVLYDPSASIPRQERIVIGQKCKRLIDWGRYHWLRSQGFEVCCWHLRAHM